MSANRPARHLAADAGARHDRRQLGRRSSDRWTEKPRQYGPSTSTATTWPTPNGSHVDFTIPKDWRSGFYALQLRANPAGAEPSKASSGFFVRADLPGPRAPMAFVASTATFLAYANSALRLDQVHAKRAGRPARAVARRRLSAGASRARACRPTTTHADAAAGASAREAPILNMRPRGNVFNYGNDTTLSTGSSRWATTTTSSPTIHPSHGLQVLKPYRCVVTGSHPEYISREIG
jgi:N,N-dimethylformamidase